MTAVEFVVAALSTWQAVEVWRHSSLTADARDRLSFYLDSEPVGRGWLLPTADAVGRWLAKLLLCPWCLSVWVGGAVSIALLSEHWAPRLVVYALAASRAANLGNDLTHAWSRTPDRGLPDTSPADPISDNEIDEGL